ncbi:MAG: GerMN domain-containing protein [Patescibacteria group bacterium]|jgi:hypothetical protein
MNKIRIIIRVLLLVMLGYLLGVLTFYLLFNAQQGAERAETSDPVAEETWETEGLASGQEVDLGFEIRNPEKVELETTIEPERLREIKLYYYNEQLDTDETGNLICGAGGIVPVTRQIPLTISPIKDTINLLLEGDLSEAEIAAGYSTEYPLAGFSLKLAVLDEDGNLTLTFDDPSGLTIGGSCRVGLLWLQIRNTALQFPEVREVFFQPDTLFQP